MNLGFRADVDAAGRLVEEQQLGLCGQPPSEQNLLL